MKKKPRKRVAKPKAKNEALGVDMNTLWIMLNLVDACNNYGVPWREPIRMGIALGSECFAGAVHILGNELEQEKRNVDKMTTPSIPKRKRKRDE